MSNSIVTFSGLRCTKVRRTAPPSQAIATATSTSAGTTATDQATVTSSAGRTQVSTASDPVPRPSITSTAATDAAETKVTSKVPGAPSSSGTSTTPAGISAKHPPASNSTGQNTLRIAIITSLGAFVLIILALLAWKLIRCRRNRMTGDATDYYATEKPQLDRGRSTQISSPGGSPFQESKLESTIHIRDSLAQLEQLPRAVANIAAGRSSRVLPDRSQSEGRFGPMDSTEVRNQSYDAALIQDDGGRENSMAIMKDQFADPSPPAGPENRLLQVGRSLSRSTSSLHTLRSSTSRERKNRSNKDESHSREQSNSSSIIVLPGRGSLSPSECTFSYQPTSAGPGQWRPDRERTSTRSSTTSTRSDPFDLEEPSITTYKFFRIFGADTQFDQTFSSKSDSTIYSPRNNDRNK
ncbi:hypothetical protein DTO271D3_458 [Paecilomyces variotii]|nr:hypothetical protein DTO271D3_458 [Paecilomyces variotii]